MNDFTKEELNAIWRWADSHSDKEWYFNLSKKIKLMINVFCNHDYIPPVGSKIPHVCGDCGKEVINE